MLLIANINSHLIYYPVGIKKTLYVDSIGLAIGRSWKRVKGACRAAKESGCGQIGMVSVIGTKGTQKRAKTDSSNRE